MGVTQIMETINEHMGYVYVQKCDVDIKPFFLCFTVGERHATPSRRSETGHGGVMYNEGRQT